MFICSIYHNTMNRSYLATSCAISKTKNAKQMLTEWDRENSRMVMSSLCSFKRPYLVASQISVSPPVASGHLLKILIPGPCPKLSESESPEMEFGNPHFLAKGRSRLGNCKCDIHKPPISTDRSHTDAGLRPSWPSSSPPGPASASPRPRLRLALAPASA